MFGWCCEVPELATITTVETTIWSANSVRTRFGPLLDNSGWCPGPVGFLQADMLASVEWWKVTGAPVMLLPAGGHVGRCGVVEGHGRAGHGTSSASAGGLAGSCGQLYLGGCGRRGEGGSELPGV